jgi:hypothetical protein
VQKKHVWVGKSSSPGGAQKNKWVPGIGGTGSEDILRFTPRLPIQECQVLNDALPVFAQRNGNLNQNMCTWYSVDPSTVFVDGVL